MDIVNSFITKNKDFEFIKIQDNTSNKMYNIMKSYEYINIILIKIENNKNKFDEYFDNDYIQLSQYDFLKHSLELLKIPKIYYTDDQYGIILIQSIEDISLKDYILEFEINDVIFHDILNLLIDFQNIKLNNYDILISRTYGQNSMINEIMPYIESIKILLFDDKIELLGQLIKIINIIECIDKTICHRNFISNNILFRNNILYLANTQNICIGPKLYDLASLLYENNINMSEQQRHKYATYYYVANNINESFESFYNKLQMNGLIRVIKNITINNIRYYNLENIFPFPALFNIVNKYKFIAMILAAGKGSRMKSNKPKAMCKINGKPMIKIIIDNIIKLNPEKIIVVVGYKKEYIIESLSAYNNIEFIDQKSLKGTGHAVLQTYNLLKNYNHNCLIHFADNPNVKYDTLVNIMKSHIKNNNDITIGTYIDDKSYTKGGRVIRKNNYITEIYEDPDINYISNEFLGGIQVYKTQEMFRYLMQINNKNIQNEYYLPDIIKICVNDKGIVDNYLIDKKELINVNSQQELLLAEQFI